MVLKIVIQWHHNNLLLKKCQKKIEKFLMLYVAFTMFIDWEKQIYVEENVDL